MLFEKIKNQIQAFATRGLSLRGWATVANTLIFSRLWFTLRILNPSKRFFEKLRSMISTFFRQNKYPRVAFSQLCLDFTRGGVDLLEPSRQHLLFQMKWIFSLFSRSDNGLVISALKYHLSFLSPISTVPSLALFEPAFRPHSICSHSICSHSICSHSICSHTSVLPVIFRALDHFGVDLDLTNLPLGLLLKLPLHRMLRNISQNYWLTRHPTLLTKSFFIADPAQKRLRLEIKAEYTVFPRLCYTLFLDLLRRRRIQLFPFLWQYILHDIGPEVLDPPRISIQSQMTSHPLWTRFTSSGFTMHGFHDATNRSE